MLPANHSSEEPRLVEAAVRVVEAGQRLILDRLDLARVDVRELATRAVRGAALIAIGAVVLAGAWFALMGGLVVWLQTYLMLWASLAIVGGLSAAAGAMAISIGIRRASGSDYDFGKPDTAGEAVRP